MGVLLLAGPRSRDVLQQLIHTDLSNAPFPWLTGQRISIGAALVDALRVNFIGELGWEIHHPIELQNYIFDKLMAAGAAFDIKPFGIKAKDSLRLEKGYKLIPRELSIEYAAVESGLDRFIGFSKPEFAGREGLLTRQSHGFSWRFVTLEVLGVTEADSRGSEPIYRDGELIGRVTSGGYGWRVNKSLALAMVATKHATLGAMLDVMILGQRHKAVIIPNSPFDPDNHAQRS
jgi:dimethylglycine dehydrogenase